MSINLGKIMKGFDVYTYFDIEQVIAEATAPPKWEEASKVHDWRNYIPKELREEWNNLDLSTKVIVFLFAEERAGYEEWD